MTGIVGPAQFERLSLSGTKLANVLIDPFGADIARTIDLGGDVPIGVYVMAHTAAGPSMQRTPHGDWVTWDGRQESLIDNRFRASNRRLAIAVIDGDLSDKIFPMTFAIAYRTAQAFKFGIFQAMPNQQLLE